MTDIYKLHDAAFAQVSAFVILDKAGDRVATIAFKFPRDGAGRLYAYVHWLGTEMVRGYANGYGYDKKTAAIESAIGHFTLPDGYTGTGFIPFVEVLKNVGGSTWDYRLREEGFTVLQAV